MISALALITLRQWRTHKLRVSLTVAGIALGVAVFFAVRTSNLTLLSSLAMTAEKLAGKATLQVAADETGFPEETIEAVRATPGVMAAEPAMEVVARTALPEETNLLIIGVPPNPDSSLREYQFDRAQTQIENPLAFLMLSDSILVSRVFASRHGLKTGDTLPLYVSAGRKAFTVRGVFQPAGVGEVFDGQVAVMNLAAAQAAFSRGHNIDRIDLTTDPNVPLATVEQKLRDRLPAALGVSRPQMRNQGIENSVAAMRLGLSVMSFVALFVSVFLIFNSLSISVNQRWKEIGILRALGVERPNVQRMFLGESACFGLIGSVAGIGAGFLMASQATRMIAAVAQDLYGYVSTLQPPPFRLDYAAESAALGIAASLVAAWLPARAASRVIPALALHNIETRRSESAVGWRRTIAGFAMIASGFALIAASSPRDSLILQSAWSWMMMLGLVLILPKLAVWHARLLRPLADSLLGAEGSIAIDSILQSPRRTMATIGALMIGLSSVFSTEGFIQSHKAAIGGYVDRALNADLFVTTSEQLRSRSYHFSEDLGRRIAALPGVSSIENNRLTTVSYAGDTPALIATDVRRWLARSRGLLKFGDQAKALEPAAKGEGVFVSENFSLLHGISLGSALRIETPSGPLERPVLGIIENYHSEKGTIFLGRELYKQYWKDAAVDYVVINLSPGADRVAFKRLLQQAISGEQRAFVYTNEEYRRWVMKLIDQFFLMNYVQMVIAFFVAALGIVNTLVISVADRRREFGVIRAIGGLRSQVRRIVLAEAAALAIIGTVAGIIGGALEMYFLIHSAATTIAGFVLPFRFPAVLIAETLPAVILVALAAAWWPARRAVRSRVIEAIGFE